MTGAFAAALLWSLVVLSSAGASAFMLDITEQSFIDKCVKEHNVARSSVWPVATGMKDMVGRAGHSAHTQSIPSVLVTMLFSSQFDTYVFLLALVSLIMTRRLE